MARGRVGSAASDSARRRAKAKRGGRAAMKTSTAARVVLVSAISVSFSAIALAGPVAAAKPHHRCLVVDVTTGANFHHLQPAVDAAPSGAKLRVKGTCVGTTVIGRNIRIVGHRKHGFGPAILDGNGHGPVVTIAGDSHLDVKLKGLRIRHGAAIEGGGIDVLRDPRQRDPAVMLIHSVVSDNSASSGGGGIMVGRRHVRHRRLDRAPQHLDVLRWRHLRRRGRRPRHAGRDKRRQGQPRR